MVKVIFDLDGVLADFEAGVCLLFNHTPFQEKDTGKPLQEILNCDKGQIWGRITSRGRSFWENLPATKWASGLVDVADNHGGFFICSSPSSSPSSLSGKLAWLQKRFGRRFRDYAFMPHKYLLAAHDRLLVDDNQEICSAFEEAGGHSMVFPTWLNGALKPGFDPVSALKQKLERIEQS